MGVKKAARAKKPTWRRFAIIGGVVVATIAIVFVVLYFSNRPNYRDLQKEYQRISAFIPSDWRLVSESSNKGTWGLFCLQVEGPECPYYIAEFSRNPLTTTSPSSITTQLQKPLIDAGLSLIDNTYQKCSTEDIRNDDYSCIAGGYIGDVEVYLSVDSTNARGVIGSWSRISIGKYEK